MLEGGAVLAFLLVLEHREVGGIAREGDASLLYGFKHCTSGLARMGAVGETAVSN